MSDSDSNHLTVLQAVLQYDPNTPLAIVSGVLFYVLAASLFFRICRGRHWWGLCLPIGALAYSTGFFLRPAVSKHPDDLGLFIAMQLLIVTAPAAFLAFNYIVYGRLVSNCAGDRYTLIRPQIVARVFVISDVTTFMVQGAGGGIESNEDSVTLGSRILLIGLILQTLSYVVFVFLLAHSHWRISKDASFIRGAFPWRVVYLLYFSSCFIIIRGIYRVIELAQGHGGFLLTHEVYFYALDTLPLFLATAIYAPFWPGKHIAPKTAGESTGSRY